ncbi:hypothetical protein [Corynebacterium belfantii]|uniref:hypothetical protein n=2 Tax=Corynebacterium belfantii TaxID=2014537 RepID=UPI0035A81889
MSLPTREKSYMNTHIPSLLTVKALQQLCDNRSNVVILDASLTMFGISELKIPIAQRFDLDAEMSDSSSDIPHTLPTRKEFEK